MSKNHQLFSIPIYQTKVKSNNFLKRMVLDSILDAAQYPHEIPPNWRTPKVKTSFVSEPEGFDIIKDKQFEKYRYTKPTKIDDKPCFSTEKPGKAF